MTLEEEVDPRIAVLMVWAIFFFVFIILPSLCLRCLGCCSGDNGRNFDANGLHADVDGVPNTGYLSGGADGWDRYMFLSAQKRDQIDAMRGKVLRRYLRRFSVSLEKGDMRKLDENDEEIMQEQEEEDFDAEMMAEARATAKTVVPSGEKEGGEAEFLRVCGRGSFKDHDEEIGMAVQDCDEELVLTSPTTSTADDTADNNTTTPQADDNNNDNSLLLPNEIKIDIIAPPGRLGVVVENPISGGHAEVVDIRAGSPLADKIRLGDKIIEVDGGDVRTMSSTAISVLLWNKSKNEERVITVSRNRGSVVENDDGESNDVIDMMSSEDINAMSLENEYTHVNIPYSGYDKDGDQVREKPLTIPEAHKSTLRFQGFCVRRKVEVLDNRHEPGTTSAAMASSSNHSTTNNSNDNPSKQPQDGARSRAERRHVPGFCAICLGEYAPSETITWSSNPDCTHVFHQECIIKWLNTLGRKSPKYHLFSADPSVSQLLNYQLECPCCRQEFIGKVVLENGEEEDLEEEVEENVGVVEGLRVGVVGGFGAEENV
jgi:hypothetical protein